MDGIFFGAFFCVFVGAFFVWRPFVLVQERKKRHFRGEKATQSAGKKEATSTWRESRTISPKESVWLQNPKP